MVPITGRFAILPMVCVSWPFTWCLHVFNFMRLLCVTQVTKVQANELLTQNANVAGIAGASAFTAIIETVQFMDFCQCTESSNARRTSRFTIGCTILVHRSPTLISLVDEVPEIHVLRA